MMIPELPNYIESMGGGELKGFIIFIFTVAAGLSRPFSGKLSDTVGRVPVIIFGAIVCVLCGLIYPFANTIFAFLFLRFIHGLSTGFTPTGTSAYVADISTLKNRGEAIGIQGLCANIGAAIGPYFGSIITASYSMDAMFYASSGMALFSVLILLGLPETLENTVGFTPKLLRLNRYDLIEKRVLFPALIMVLLMFSFGVVVTVIPDLSIYLGMAQKDKGLFYLYLTLASIAVRLFAGKASDKYGR
ncbi:MAG: MFS family permease, partial [Arenicella sp.]